MGLDEILYIQSPLTKNDYFGLGDPIEFNKSVKTKISIIHDKNEEYPLIVKEYNTSGGTLCHKVRKTGDWNSDTDLPFSHGGNNLLLFDDYNVSRSGKFLIEKEGDIRKLKYLFLESSSLFPFKY